MSENKTQAQLIQEMVDREEITETQGGVLSNKLGAVAAAGSAYRDGAVRECLPIIIAAQFNLRQSFIDMKAIWNDHIGNSGPLRKDSTTTLNNVDTTVFDWSAPAARGSAGATHLPIPAHTRDFAIMFHHMRGFGAPLESDNSSHPNTHRFAHYGKGPGPRGSGGGHTNYAWTSNTLPSGLVDALTVDAPEDTDSDEGRAQSADIAEGTNILSSIAGDGRATLMRAFAAQMAARTSDSNWEEKVKLSYMDSEGVMEDEMWAAATASTGTAGYETHGARYIGSSMFRNGTFGDAWASLQALAASDPDASALVSRLASVAAAAQRALREFAQGWECMANIAQPICSQTTRT